MIAKLTVLGDSMRATTGHCAIYTVRDGKDRKLIRPVTSGTDMHAATDRVDELEQDLAQTVGNLGE